MITLFDADEKATLDELGEDTCELFEAIETSFGITLGDYQDLIGMTVRELAVRICEKANYPNQEKCLSAVSFYRLRRAFQELFGVPREAIRSDTPLSKLMPWLRRRERWRLLQDSFGAITLPSLTFPGWLILFCLIAPVASLISLKVYSSLPITWLLIFFWSIALIVAMIWAVSPLARAFPKGSETFGGLAKEILARNYGAFAAHGGSSNDDVLLALRHLVAMETAISLEKISPETRIPRDLNIY
jgi:hypothetical protein